jgi:hypothetical protein
MMLAVLVGFSAPLRAQGPLPSSPAIGQEEHLARSPTKGLYQLTNGFGATVSFDVREGTYRIALPAQGTAASSMRGAAVQAWLGTGMVSVLANHKWYRSTPPKLYHATEGDGELGQMDALAGSVGQLMLSSIKTGSASDRFGSYTFIEIRWTAPDGSIPLVTAFHLYQDRPYLIFVQRFPSGFQGYANGNWTIPSVAFPQFVGSHYGIPQNLSLWTSGGMWSHRLAYGDAFSIQGTVEPLVLSDPADHAVILSPFDHYLVATQQSRPTGATDAVADGSISCGIEGLVQNIPAGFEHATIMVSGTGIHNTLYAWGHALLEKAGKTAPSKYQDDTLRYPVYVDDAGAYYYEHNFKEPGYSSYADIILAIEKESNEHDLRIGAYHVLDDAQQRNRSDGLFEPRADLFPEGLAKFHQRLGKPLELYMMWIKPNGPYRKEYKFFVTDPGDIPFSMGDVFYSKEYWRDTADKLSSWGTILLQHDFLSDYEGNRAMMSTVDNMDLYFRNMAEALQAKGIDIQYCMALPRNILQSTENPVMVSLQATEDHHVPMVEANSQPANPDNYDPFFWKQVIFTSALYGALGIWPSRDNIQTISDPNAFEDVLLANLLGGSIQLGHRLGECNFELLKKTYREGDGLVLKADWPIHPIDRCYHEGCAVGYTQSKLGGHTWSYILSLPSAGYTSAFSPSDLGDRNLDYAVYNWDTHVIQVKSPEAFVPLIHENKHEYFVMAPILKNGMAIFGDTSKFITMADKRIASVDDTDTSVAVGVIADQKYSPVIAGYSAARPDAVMSAGSRLEEVSSVDRLRQTKSGWLWDYQSKTWWVKVDFADAPEMTTKLFVISSSMARTQQ